MESLLQTIADHLSQGLPFGMATILEDSGSTPRGTGSRMIVTGDRSVFGTIGGGLLEAKVIDECVRHIGTSRSQIVRFTLDREAKQGMDMICGGNLAIWIQTFAPPFPPALIQNYMTLKKLELQGQGAMLISRVKQHDIPETWLDYEGNGIEEPGLAPLVRRLQDNMQAPNSHLRRESYEGDEYIAEFLNSAEILYIFGAGHVGLRLAEIAHIAEFPHVVIDDRDEFANKDRFPHARAIHVTDCFSKVLTDLHVNENSYIAILTRGHLHDQAVLEQALNTKAKYIGMIGSRRKKEVIFSNLKEQGVSMSQLERVRAPIGIDIKAETPAEIAISIIGELIMKRAASTPLR